jgi:ribonucleoside-triphosphate reductase
MYFKTTYITEFDDLYMHLKAKYPQKLFDLDGIGKQLDMSEFSKNFFASNVTADASVDANANVDDVSVIAYNTELPKPFFKINSYFILWKELRRLYGLEVANNIVEMQLTGDIYIHDFHGIGAGMPYCFNYSTYDIMTKGLSMVKKVKSLPPKYLYAFKSQLEQFTVVASNSTLGATGLADMLVVMSYYVKKILTTGNDAGFYFDGWFSDGERELIQDELVMISQLDRNSEEEMKQIEELLKGINTKLNNSKTQAKHPTWFQQNVFTYVKENLVSFIYTINQPMRANQSPFTNISVYDDFFLDKLCDDYLFPDGTTPDKELVKQLQTFYLNIMNKELKRTPLTFPVTTACFSIDECNNIKDNKFLKKIAEANKEFGFINIYCGDSSTLSSCCRLRSEQKSEYFNSFGSGSSKIGSLGVCSINFPRLAIKYSDKNTFLTELQKMVEVCAKINNAKRHIVEKRIKNGNEPLYTLGFMELSKQYSTVGVNGFNECIELLGESILEEKGQELAVEILDTINKINAKFQKQYNAPHNCEQVPAEGMSVKMADKDKLLGYQNTYDIYSNQFIPLTTNADMLDRIKLQGMFDKHFSGGAICHLNIDTQIENIEDIMDLIKSTAKMGVVYFAINYVLCECEDGHMSVGNNDICSICGKPIKNKYSRVVGFLTNIKNWIKTRREKDFPNRQFYNGIKM